MRNVQRLSLPKTSWTRWLCFALSTFIVCHRESLIPETPPWVLWKNVSIIALSKHTFSSTLLVDHKWTESWRRNGSDRVLSYPQRATSFIQEAADILSLCVYRQGHYAHITNTCHVSRCGDENHSLKFPHTEQGCHFFSALLPMEFLCFPLNYSHFLP